MGAKESHIDPPPSLADILATGDEESRLGRVDFRQRLAAQPGADETPEDESPARETSSDAADFASQHDEELGEIAGPMIMPVAHLDQALAAELPKPRGEAAETQDGDDEPDVAPDSTQPPATMIGKSLRDISDSEASPTSAPTETAPGLSLATPIKAMPQKPRAAAQKPAAPAPTPTPTPTPAPALPAAKVTAPPVKSTPTATAGATEQREVTLSVEEVAASVIARMEAAGEANQRHLEAIESEAARRCEMLTAQAELDAELIRLHARREAHAIITAARMRAGGGASDSEESARLHEIGETFSRFAESIETTSAQALGTPDNPSHP